MKKWHAFLMCIFYILITTQHLFAQKAVCGFSRMLDKQADSDAYIHQRLFEVNETLNEATSGIETNISFRDNIIIPVVFHVVWKTPEENVSDQTILTQIDALNRDFNNENTDLYDVPDEFQPFIAAEGIRFCLAAEDSQDLPTSGIVRIKTDVETIGTKENLFFSDLGGSSAWDTNKYLNIWVANTGEFITGFGTFPGQVETEKQGVVIHPKYFGENNSQRYNLGRVAVHEVGHYLGLTHAWDGNTGCDTDDGVADTPVQQHAYEGCPGHPQVSCGSSDMFMNFMDYVNDDCMVMFTQGQMERMIATIEIFRSEFLDTQIACIKHTESEMDSDFLIYPNPVKEVLTIDFTTSVAETGNLEIYNSVGQLVYEYKGIIRNEMKLNLPVLISGMYWIKIGEKAGKFIMM